MQFLSNSQLKNLGFSNPEKVNVYGYGGQLISEVLDTNQPDDLPLVPILRTDNGILFFGVNTIKWELASNSRYGTYWHTMHDYDDSSYYFLSDREAITPTVGAANNSASSSDTEFVTFIERVLHENDLTPQPSSGRQILGEDFLTTNARTFTFLLPGNVGQEAQLTSRFITRTTSASSFVLSANGQQIGSKITMNPISSNNHLGVGTRSQSSVPVSDERLDIQVRATIPKTGVNYFAALDFLKLEYERELRLTDGELYFYLPAKNGTAVIKGCSSTTVVWDITDPKQPKDVTTSLQEDVLRFNHSGNSYREYIAFDASRISRTPVSSGNVSNQDIHSLPVPDMLIITPAEFKSEAERVADLRRRVDGFIVHVLTPDMLYNEFSCGSRDISAFRKALKMWHDRGTEGDRQVRYCLIMGRPTYDRKGLLAVSKTGYERIPTWYNPSFTSSGYESTKTDDYELTSYGTDDIIGMLDDCPNSTFNIMNAQIQVAVGRMPVKSQTEARQMVDKLIKYVEEPDLGSWRNNLMFIADDQDGGVHLSQTENVVNAIGSNPIGDSYSVEKLYFDAYPIISSGTGLSYPGPRSKYAQKIEEGVMYVSYIGHGHARGLSHENFLTWNDINSMSNTRLPFFYTATCIFTPWDSDIETAGETLYLNPTSGYIGLLTTTRSTSIPNNGILSRSLAEGMFSRQEDGGRPRIGDIYRLGKNKVTSDDNKLRFIIVGDPALQLPIPQATVAIDSIAGVDINDESADNPVLGARGRAIVSGHIEGADGQPDTSFNGTVELVLFDAEKVITTYGNGTNDPLEKTYNDRSSKLCRVNTPVKDGKWTTTLFIPSEIENNTSSARITAYAYSNAGIEANGHSDRLFVYGFDEDAPEDNQGPDISRFTLNNDAFRNGGAVNSTPIVLATFSDESGINLSSVGIGHSMSLVLDGKKRFTDIANYFTPAQDDPCSGSLSYLLDQIEPGDHTLEITVWDNAGNSSSASLSFTVAAHASPVISSLSSDANPARSGVTFTLTTEMPEPGSECVIDVFDLNGRRLWSQSATIKSASETVLSFKWDLRDSSGHRVPRGIYLYRAYLRTSSGIVDSVTKKLAVAAP